MFEEDEESVGTAVLGAGPAGLTAAYVLARRGSRAAVFEAGGQVGGIARTVVHDGYRFDLGGHRFFTKVGVIQSLWRRCSARTSSCGRGSRGSTTTGGSWPTRSRRRTCSPGSASSSPLCRSRTSAPASPPTGDPRRRSRTGSSPASGAASTTPSSARTRRRSGGSRAPRSARSGPPSASRTSRSGVRCSPWRASGASTSPP